MKLLKPSFSTLSVRVHLAAASSFSSAVTVNALFPFCIKPIIFLTFLCFPGDIQIGMMEKKGQLEVEVIRARGLVQKPGSKSLPGENLTDLEIQKSNWSLPPSQDITHTLLAYLIHTRCSGKSSVYTPCRNLLCAFPSHEDIIICEIWSRSSWRVTMPLTNSFFIVLSLPSAPYVKVYLLNNGAYVAKKKTKIARKTLDPLYQQALLFEESPQGKVLQVSGRSICLCICFSFFDKLLIKIYFTGETRLLCDLTQNDFPSGDCMGWLRPHGP